MGMDDALKAARVLRNPVERGEKGKGGGGGEGGEGGGGYGDGVRKFQGIPGIERAVSPSNGRLWATWYSGGVTEGPENYVVLVTSADEGRTWSDIKLVVEPEGLVRAYDPCLWVDPLGRLWFFWAQSEGWWDGRSGVWAMVTENPGEEEPVWSRPRRLADGIMMNKPTALSDGRWLLPVAIWQYEDAEHRPQRHPAVVTPAGAQVHVSSDQGESWSYLGYAAVPKELAVFEEHMIVERKDGSLWMLVRYREGIGQSESFDGGRTWSALSAFPLEHTSSRFFIRRLASGNLLLVKHNSPGERARSHLTAYVSTDDGRTWSSGLLLDERVGVSYPDGVQTPDGRILIIYDYNRMTDKYILMCEFIEEDALAGKEVSGKVRLRGVVNQAKGGGGGN